MVDGGSGTIIQVMVVVLPIRMLVYVPLIDTAVEKIVVATSK